VARAAAALALDARPCLGVEVAVARAPDRIGQVRDLDQHARGAIARGRGREREDPRARRVRGDHAEAARQRRGLGRRATQEPAAAPGQRELAVDQSIGEELAGVPPGRLVAGAGIRREPGELAHRLGRRLEELAADELPDADRSAGAGIEAPGDGLVLHARAIGEEIAAAVRGWPDLQPRAGLCLASEQGWRIDRRPARHRAVIVQVLSPR
jgi:hypothetical protein